MSTTASVSFRQDYKVIGLVGLAHCLSHFFQLALPPLFPFLKDAFEVSYAALGSLVATFYVASGLTQFAAGFVVDRIGARPVLLVGSALIAGGALIAGAAPSFAWLYLLVLLMGIGNGVFHPADFAILNARVLPARLGLAYSTHGVGGNLGFALAPIVSYALGAAIGWRMALVTMGACGMAVWALLATQRSSLACAHRSGGHRATLEGSITMLAQAPILLCFAYFLLATMATSGLMSFAPMAFEKGYGIPLVSGAAALTGYLLGSTAGIVVGGVLASRSQRHAMIASLGLLTAATLIVALASSELLRSMLVPVFVITGFALGCTGPSRDLIVRGATPSGASGRVYGFVYSGLDVGGTLGPLATGFMLDHGAARSVLYAVAACLLFSIGTVLNVRRTQERRVVA